MKRKDKKIFYITIAAILILTAVITGGLFLKNYMDKKKARDFMEQLKNTSVDTSTPNESIIDAANDKNVNDENISIPIRNVDWEFLQTQNTDIYAWIYIPGTNVDYPVFQHKSSDEFYLWHNMDGSEGAPGVVYTEGSVTSKYFTDKNTVIYGHNFNDDSMFSTLHNYHDSEFFKNHRYIYIYTPEKVYVYKIFAAYTTSNIHPLKSIDLSSPSAYKDYLESIFAHDGSDDNFDREFTMTTNDRIVTLLTCTKDYADEYRYYVQGVLVNSDY